MKLIKIIPVVLMGLFLSVNLPAASLSEGETINQDTIVMMEDWMFDTNYLTAGTETVESWMLDENWLEEAIETSPVESWMMDGDYLVNETQEVEPWMLNENYLKDTIRNCKE